MLTKRSTDQAEPRAMEELKKVVEVEEYTVDQWPTPFGGDFEGALDAMTFLSLICC